MKNVLLILISLSVVWSVNAREIELPVHVLDTSFKDGSLKLDEAVYKFTFKSTFDDLGMIKKIQYRMDNEIGELILEDNSVEIKTSPGKHMFQFYVSDSYYEVFIDSLEIKPQFRDNYSIYLADAIDPIEVEKPVIYLYPTSELDIEVKLNVKGKITFTYPVYNNGWRFTATPNGTLNFGTSSYNYLFWESEQHYVLSWTDRKTGFLVKSEEVVAFLEEKLTIAGLSSKERADFITYWGPKLIQNETNFIHFEFNEECNKFAELIITPKPETVYQINMSWSSIDENYEVTEQEIITLKRTGFTVVEWGGQQVTINSKTANLIKP
jgi:hypothetical protein